jgi:predicted RNase H-like HicB family nuclease
MTKAIPQASQYTFQVIWDKEEGVYIAKVAEFPRFSGVGATRTEAIAEAEIALELALEANSGKGWSVPVPIERPVTPSGQLRLRLGKSLHAATIAAAEQDGVSLNTFLTTCIALVVGAKSAAQAASRSINIALTSPFTAKSGYMRYDLGSGVDYSTTSVLN